MVTFSQTTSVEDFCNVTWDYRKNDLVGKYRNKFSYRCAFRIDEGIGFKCTDVVCCNLNQGWILLKIKPTENMEVIEAKGEYTQVKFSGILTIGNEKKQVIMRIDQHGRKL